MQTVYEEMEVDAEMQRGLLPGALALSAKFVPSLRAVAARTVEVCEGGPFRQRCSTPVRRGPPCRPEYHVLEMVRMPHAWGLSPLCNAVACNRHIIHRWLRPLLYLSACHVYVGISARR